MRLRRIRIDGYGSLRDVDLEPGPAATVITGPNEVGKTTLADFIPAVIYGFADGRSNRNAYPCVAGGRRGGWLEFDLDGKAYRVERRYEPGDRVAGRMSLLVQGEEVGRDCAPQQLVHLWGGLPMDTFESLFCFGLEELEDIRSLDADRIGDLLYATASGLDARRIDRLHRALEDQKMALYRPRAASQIGDTLEALQTIGAQGHRSSINDHLALERKISETSAEISSLEEALRVARTDQQRVENALEAEPLQHRISEIAHTLERMDALEPLAPGTKQQLEHVESRLSEIDAALVTVDEKLMRLNAQIDTLLPEDADRRMLENADLIDHLWSKAASMEEMANRQTALRARRDNLSQEIATVLEELGPGWTARRALGFRITNEERQEIQSLDDELQRFKQQRHGLVGQIELLQGTLRELEQEKAVHDQYNKAEHLQRRTTLLHQLENMLREYRSLKNQIDLLDRAEQTPEDTTSRWIPRIIVILGLGASGVLYAIDLYTPALLASIGTLLGWFAMWLGQLSFRRRTPSNTLRTQLDERRQECEEKLLGLSEEFFGAPRIISDEDLQQARECLVRSRIEDRLHTELHQEYAHKRRTLQSLHAQLDKVDRYQEQLRDRAVSRLADMGFPPGTLPAAALRFLDPVDRIRRAHADLGATVKENAAIEEVLAEFCRNVSTITGENDAMRMDPSQARDGLIRVREQLRRASERVQSRRELETERATLLSRKNHEMAQRKHQSQKLQDLLQSTSSPDIAYLRKRIGCEDRAAPLREEKLQLEVRVGQMLGEDGEDPVFEDSPPDAQQLQQVREHVSQIEASLGERRELIGALRSEKRRLGDARTDAERTLARETLVARLREQHQDWMRLQAASWLLEQARNLGESERAPGVIGRASDIFAYMTEGRYSAIHAYHAPDGSRRLDVTAVDARGRVGTEALSRGTLGQMYLALRLATVEAMAEEGHTPPVIMDDPFVNFDQRRLERALNCIHRSSEKLQILLLTCHANTVSLMQEYPDVATLRLGDHGHRAIHR